MPDLETLLWQHGIAVRCRSIGYEDPYVQWAANVLVTRLSWRIAEQLFREEASDGDK